MALALGLAAVCLPAAAAADPVEVTALRTDHMVDPLGIDDPAPSFGWQLRSDRRGVAQTAYQVQVADSAEALEQGQLTWNSGRVQSAESVDVPYTGPPLAAQQRCVWRVRVWDEGDSASAWSQPASWEMALSDGDWHGAEWISPRGATDASAWTDYRLDVDVTIASGAAGVVFRAQGPLDFYMWQLNVEGGEVLLRPHVQEDGDWRVLDEIDVSAAVPPSTAHAQHHLTIAVEGTTIVTSIDGQEVDSRADGTFASGSIGFRSGASSEDASFDNLAVTGPDDEQLFADDFETAPDPAFPGADVVVGVLRARDAVPLISTTPPVPQLRREFSLQQPLADVASARAYVYGLGFYELRLSGTKVGDRQLAPGATDFDSRLRYQTYDVGQQLREGDNALAMTLTEGYGPSFSPYGWRWQGPRQALILLDVSYDDGSHQRIVSDETWRWDEGPVRQATIYGGETYDARLLQPGWDEPGFDDAGWQPVRTVPAPAGELEADTAPPVRVVRTLRPVALAEPDPGAYVFDLGENIAGWARIHAAGESGDTVRLRYAEDVDSSGRLDTFTNGPAAATDTFVLAGAGEETLEPAFTYHGFRYVEVTGLSTPPPLDTLEGRVVHADMEPTASFESSDPMLDRIYENGRRTMANNAMSYPTDNPVRNERTGPGMDVNAYGDAAVRDFDADRFFAAYLKEIDGGYGGSPDMYAAHIPLAWSLYEQYGDRRALAGSYPGMVRALESYANEAPTGVWPVADTLGGDGFGDWCPPVPLADAAGGVGDGETGGYALCFSEISLVNTALAYRNARLVAAAARALGHDADAVGYDQQAEQIAAAFESEFAVPGGYGSRRQVTSVLPLAFGIVPPARRQEVGEGLVDRVLGPDNGHLDTGIFGTRYLLDALIAAGRPDVGQLVLDQTSYPGFGYQIGFGSQIGLPPGHGATTTWEEWTYKSGMETHDHAMFAGIDASFITGLAGIKPAAPGYAQISIDPVLPPDLDHVAATLKTVRGEVASAWTRGGGGLRLDVSVPPNAAAAVHLPLGPGEEATESGLPARCAPGVTATPAGAAVLEVGSGAYAFAAVPAGTASCPVLPGDGGGGQGPGRVPADDLPGGAGAGPSPGGKAPSQPRLRVTARLARRGRLAVAIACRDGCPERPRRLKVTVAAAAKPHRRLGRGHAWLHQGHARLVLPSPGSPPPSRLLVSVSGLGRPVAKLVRLGPLASAGSCAPARCW